jgi:hypothetical protein
VLLAPSATIVAAWADADTKADIPIRIDKTPRVPSRKARNFMLAPFRVGLGSLRGQYPLAQPGGPAASEKNLLQRLSIRLPPIRRLP